MITVISPVKKEARAKIGIRAGDTVSVHQKVIERGKTRIQTFEGIVIAVKHGREAGGTFTVRTTLSGVGVEKIFPLYSPLIDKIKIVRRSKVRRAKLYFIREKAAKAVRRQLRNAKIMDLSTEDFTNEESKNETETENKDDEKSTKDAEVTETKESNQSTVQESKDASEASPKETTDTKDETKQEDKVESVVKKEDSI